MEIRVSSYFFSEGGGVEGFHPAGRIDSSRVRGSISAEVPTQLWAPPPPRPPASDAQGLDSTI